MLDLLGGRRSRPAAQQLAGLSVVFALSTAVLCAGYQVTWRGMLGLLRAGWGIFNLIEGVIDHHLLTIHHVRDDVADPLWWDVGFLALGALLVVAGFALRRRDLDHTHEAPRSASAQL